MQELITSIHIHTTYSDGRLTHEEIIETASESGINVLFFTDHNIFVKGMEGYYDIDGKKMMVIMGEEIHDSSLFPQKNHLLALGINSELSNYANNRQELINQIHHQKGAAYLAHPFDPSLPDFHEPDISWTDWMVDNFDGIELWNGFSELKVRSTNRISPYFYAFFPKFLPFRPPLETIQIWEKFLNAGKKVSAIAGADAHGIKYSAGPFHRIMYPYSYHFSTINNHILIKKELKGNFHEDKSQVIGSLISGRNFIANDLISPSKGFRFYITERDIEIGMGEMSKFSDEQKINMFIPDHAETRIMKNGEIYYQHKGKGIVQKEIDGPGIYRIECYKTSRFKNRGWIFSNPIYII